MKSLLICFRCALAVFCIAMAIPGANAAVSEGQADLFQTLRGRWGGSGLMYLTGNRRERLVCDAQYTGSATQLRLAIKCKSKTDNIDLQATLSANDGRLAGVWQEKSYKAVGTISGTATDSEIKFQVAGNVFGSMTVKYTRRRQTVSIETTGIPLQKLQIEMTRR
jgi:hypothetical protein